MTNDAGLADPRGTEEAPTAIAPETDVIAFGEFTVHLRSAELFRNGAAVKLQLQPFRVLAALLKRPGTLVTREELRREVWGEHTAVDFEHGLNFCIKQVRAALGDSAENPSFIETLPRRGYRFVARIADRGADIGSSRVTREETSSSALVPGRESAGVRRAPSSRMAWMAFLGVALSSLVLALFALRARSRDPHAPAVLFVVPFENLTGDRESDVWCDGLTEELIAALASADPKRVQVIARTTSMSYRAARKPLREIGRQVKADLALEGAVRKDGDRLRVTAQLYRLQEETPVWAQAFETTGTDALSVQRLLAAHIAGSLALAVDPDVERPVSSVAAQGALAKARYLRNKNESEAMAASVAAFEEALRLDPDNATVWSEAAMAYDAAAGVLPAAMATGKSCAAAKRARELSSREALADTAFGLCSMQRDWDWTAAETAFGTALAKNPGLAATHHVYAAFLSAAGRHREAMAAIERAKRLDPLSPAIVSDAGWHAYLARDYPAAIREFERTLELEPKDPWSREHLMASRALAGDSAGAAKDAAAWAALFPQPEEEKAALAALPSRDVVRRAAEIIAQRFAAREKGDRPPNPGFVATKYAAAGNLEEAMAWLERGASQHSPWFLPILRDPRFDALRGDARFQAIAARAHLPVALPTP